MSQYKEKIININTGEETWRDYTPEEISEAKKFEAEAQIKTIEAQEREATRQSALAKLAALGLTEEEIASL